MQLPLWSNSKSISTNQDRRKMAKQIEFGKFLVIECTAREMYVACGSPGICDNCCSTPSKGYYVAVLNRWLCQECYDQWCETAHWYREDAGTERKNFEYYAPKLGLRI